MKKSILVFCAHPDDDIIGVGGTLAKYASEGYKITVVIFSYGELSHPWIKKTIAIKTRKKESRRAHKIIGCSEGIFLGLKEGRFKKEIKEKNAEKILQRIIDKKNPSKIFVHSWDDPHTDHRAIYEIITKLLKGLKKSYSVYCFDIWNPINIRKRHLPVLYVNISKTFEKKIKALKCFESQKKYIFPLVIGSYIKAIKNGLESGSMFAEAFYKIA